MKKYLSFLFIIGLLTCTATSFASDLNKSKDAIIRKKVRDSNPAPPAGQWAAIYTAGFAKKFNLPKDGVTNKLENAIEYMEAVSVPAKKLEKFNEMYPDQDCVLNIVTNKNHDIPLYEEPSSGHLTTSQKIQNQKVRISNQMKYLDKPLQFLERNNKYSATYRSIAALRAIHSADVLPGYDYFSSKDFRCRSFLQSLRSNRDIKENKFLKASVVAQRARESSSPNSLNEWRTVTVEKGDNASFITITVPKALAKGLYQGVDVPPEYRGRGANIDPARLPAAVLMLPLIPFWGLGAPKANNEPHNIGVPAVWPKDVPTHFRLEATGSR